MPIIFKTGDMFDHPADAIINTVNVKGVMGKGVALEFKKRWPDNFKAYKALCDEGALKPGVLYVHDTGDLVGKHRYLMNFPTKVDWRNPSKLEYIDEGLDALIDEIHAHGIRSIVMPPLGCGNGGLDWAVVREMIVDRLQDFDDVDIIVYEPATPKAAPSTPEAPPAAREAIAPKVTFERAVLLKAIDELPLKNLGEVHDLVEALQRHDLQYVSDFHRRDGGWRSTTLETALNAMIQRGLLVMLHFVPVVTDAGKAMASTLEGADLMRANRIVLAVRDELIGPEPENPINGAPS